MSAGLLVAPCSHAAARFAVEHWHYSRCMPMPPAVYYGVWEHGSFIGAVIFGRGASPHLLTVYGLDTTQGAELTRVALRAHESPVSMIVTRAIRLLHAANPGLRLIVSFADPAHGHRGSIYQAMNWVYTGRSSAQPTYRDQLGRLHHQRVVSRSGKTTQYGKKVKSPKIENLTRVDMPGKHRYLYPLDKKMRRQVEKLARPYPRGRGVDGDAPASPVGEVSSTLAGRSDIEDGE